MSRKIAFGLHACLLSLWSLAIIGKGLRDVYVCVHVHEHLAVRLSVYVPETKKL